MTKLTAQYPENGIRERLKAFLEQKTITFREIDSEEFQPLGQMMQHYIWLSNVPLEREVVLCSTWKYKSALDLLCELLEGVYYGTASANEDDFLNALDLSPDIESHHEFYALCNLQSAQLEYLLGRQCFMDDFLAIYQDVFLDENGKGAPPNG